MGNVFLYAYYVTDGIIMIDVLILNEFFISNNVPCHAYL